MDFGNNVAAIFSLEKAPNECKHPDLAKEIRKRLGGV